MRVGEGLGRERRRRVLMTPVLEEESVGVQALFTSTVEFPNRTGKDVSEVVSEVIRRRLPVKG